MIQAIVGKKPLTARVCGQLPQTEESHDKGVPQVTTTIHSGSAASAGADDTPPAEEELRVCKDCIEVKPLTDFRRRFRGRDDRMYQCRQCHALAERLRLKHRREIQTGKRMQAIATAARNPRAMKRLLKLMESGVLA